VFISSRHNEFTKDASGAWLPRMICGDEARFKQMHAYAQQISTMTKQRVTVAALFEKRTDLEDIEPMNEVTLSLYLVSETKRALLFSEGDSDEGSSPFWVSRSLVSRITKMRQPTRGHLRLCSVTMPQWKADELGLDYDQGL
jgi:hypothetical protein